MAFPHFSLHYGSHDSHVIHKASVVVLNLLTLRKGCWTVSKVLLYLVHLTRWRLRFPALSVQNAWTPHLLVEDRFRNIFLLRFLIQSPVDITIGCQIYVAVMLREPSFN